MPILKKASAFPTKGSFKFHSEECLSSVFHEMGLENLLFVVSQKLELCWQGASQEALLNNKVALFIAIKIMHTVFSLHGTVPALFLSHLHTEI